MKELAATLTNPDLLLPIFVALAVLALRRFRLAVA